MDTLDYLHGHVKAIIYRIFYCRETEKTVPDLRTQSNTQSANTIAAYFLETLMSLYVYLLDVIINVLSFKFILVPLILIVVFVFIAVTRKISVNDNSIIVRRSLNDNKHCVNIKHSVIIWVFLYVLIPIIVISCICEYILLYQIEVAKRVTIVSKGLSDDCVRQKDTWVTYIKASLKWLYSWSTDDHCHEYHKALTVDPFWELNPLLVLTSLLSRCFLHPFKVTSSTLGKVLREFFTEIPAQWQLLISLMLFTVVFFVIMATCGYSVRSPLLSIEDQKRNLNVEMSDTHGVRLTSKHSKIKNHYDKKTRLK